MEMPDVTGFALGEAKEVIGMAGIEIKSISATAPPRCKLGVIDDTYRVVRLNGTDDGKIELLVCNPNMK